MSSRPARFVPPTPSEQSPEQRRLQEAVVSGPRARSGRAGLVDADGRLLGPFGPMLLSPALGTALQAVGAEVRYGTQLSDRVRETAVLMVAAHERSAFEQHAHEPLALAAGLTEDDLAALRAGRAPVLLDEVEEVAASVVRTALTGEDLDDEAYDRAVEVLGERGLYELLTLVGYYRLLALQMRVLHVEPPAGPAQSGPAQS